MPQSLTPVQVQHWSIDNIITYGDHVIHELAIKSAGTMTSYRLVLGRCLVAIDQTKLYQQFGCSGAVHYAGNILGIGKKEACALRRVARELERLPRMRQVAEHGTIYWSKLREIVGKATPETEEAWLALARRMSGNQLRRLAKNTKLGELPWTESGETPRDLTHFRLQLQDETHELFQRAAQAVSKKLGKVVTVTEALERLAVELLEKKPATDGRVERARAEASASQADHRARRARLVEEARAIVAEEVEREDPLASLQQALGSDPLFVPAEGEEDTQAEMRPARDGMQVERDARPARDEAPVEESAPKTDAERLAEWRFMFEATDKPCPGSPSLSIADPDHWKAIRLRFNPKARKLTMAQRREILRRDGHRCRVPGCTHHVWLDVHHYIPLQQNGPTLPWNLLTLCTRCHANVHAGFLIIESDGEGGFRFLNQGLTSVYQPSPLEVAHWIDFWLGWSGGPDDCHKGRDWAFEAAG